MRDLAFRIGTGGAILATLVGLYAQLFGLGSDGFWFVFKVAVFIGLFITVMWVGEGS